MDDFSPKSDDIDTEIDEILGTKPKKPAKIASPKTVSTDIDTEIDDILSGFGGADPVGKTVGKSAIKTARKRSSSPYDHLIEDSASRHGVDPDLIRRQMGTESSFNPKAKSNKNAMGLMQLIPDTARRLGVKDIYDPKQNIEGGVKYMRQLLDMFGGDVSLALAGYNAGEGAVKKYGNRVPPYQETRNYVKKIGSGYTGNGYLRTKTPKGETQSTPRDVDPITSIDDEIDSLLAGMPPAPQAPEIPDGSVYNKPADTPTGMPDNSGSATGTPNEIFQSRTDSLENPVNVDALQEAMNVASNQAKLGAIAQAAKQGINYTTDIEPVQKKLQERFDAEKAANPSLTAEQFNARLAAENKKTVSRKGTAAPQSAQIATGLVEDSSAVPQIDPSQPISDDDAVKITDVEDGVGADPNGIAGEIRYSRAPKDADPVEWAKDDIAQGLSTKFGISFNVARSWIEKNGIGTDPRQGNVKNLNPAQIAEKVKNQDAFYLQNKDLNNLLMATKVESIYTEGRKKGLRPSEAYKGLLGQGLMDDARVNEIVAESEAQERDLLAELRDQEQAKTIASVRGDAVAYPEGKAFRSLDKESTAGALAEGDQAAINKAANEQLNKILAEYGTVDSYRMSQAMVQGKLRAIKEERDKMAATGLWTGVSQFTVPLQAVSNAFQAGSQVVTDLAAFKDIFDEFMGIPTFDDMIHNVKTAENRLTPAAKRMLYKASEDSQKWIEKNSYNDDLLNTSAFLNDIPKAVTQMVMQVAAGAVTGTAGAGALMGAAQGVKERYKEAYEGGATPNQRRLTVATAAAAAIPEYFITKGILARAKLADASKIADKFFGNTARQLYGQFRGEFGDAEARELTRSALSGLASKWPRFNEVVKGAGGLLKPAGEEAIQEVWLEDKVNNAVAYATYDKSQTRWNQVQFLTNNDVKTMGISAVAGAAGGALGTALGRLSQGANKILINGKEFDTPTAAKPLLNQAMSQYDTALQTWASAKELYEQGRKQPTQEARREWRQAARNAYTQGVREFNLAETIYNDAQVAAGGSASTTPLAPVQAESVQRRDRKERTPKPPVEAPRVPSETTKYTDIDSVQNPLGKEKPEDAQAKADREALIQTITNDIGKMDNWIELAESESAGSDPELVQWAKDNDLLKGSVGDLLDALELERDGLQGKLRAATEVKAVEATEPVAEPKATTPPIITDFDEVYDPEAKQEQLPSAPEKPQLAANNPYRADTADPEMVKRAQSDSKAQKILGVLEGKTLGIDELGKATKFGASALNKAVDVLVKARIVEVLPPSEQFPKGAIRKISDEGQAPSLYEQYTGETVEAPEPPVAKKAKDEILPFTPASTPKVDTKEYPKSDLPTLVQAEIRRERFEHPQRHLTQLSKDLGVDIDEAREIAPTLPFYTDERLAKKFNVPVEKVSELRPLGSIGYQGYVSHRVRSTILDEAYQNTFNELSDIFTNGEVRFRDADYEGKFRMSNAVLDKIAESVGKSRSSQMTKQDWSKVLIKHAKTLSDEAGMHIVRAMEEGEDWQKEADAFRKSPELRTLIDGILKDHGVSTWEDLNELNRQAYADKHSIPFKDTYGRSGVTGHGPAKAIKKAIKDIGKKYAKTLKSDGNRLFTDEAITRAYDRAIYERTNPSPQGRATARQAETVSASVSQKPATRGTASASSTQKVKPPQTKTAKDIEAKVNAASAKAEAEGRAAATKAGAIPHIVTGAEIIEGKTKPKKAPVVAEKAETREEVAPEPKKTSEVKEKPKKVVVDPEAVRRKNVESDGKVWRQGQVVDPTDEVTAQLIESAEAGQRQREDTLAKLKEVQAKGLEDGYEINRAIESIVGVDHWYGTDIDKAVRAYEGDRPGNKQYIADIKQANEAYNASQKQSAKAKPTLEGTKEEIKKEKAPIKTLHSVPVTAKGQSTADAQVFIEADIDPTVRLTPNKTSSVWRVKSPDGIEVKGATYKEALDIAQRIADGIESGSFFSRPNVSTTAVLSQISRETLDAENEDLVRHLSYDFHGDWNRIGQGAQVRSDGAGTIVWLNREARLIVNNIYREAGIWSGVYNTLTGTTQLYRGLADFHTAAVAAGKLALAKGIERVFNGIIDGIDLEYGDTILYAEVPDAPNLTQYGVQEELSHRADIRIRKLASWKSIPEFEKNPAYAQAARNLLDGAYAGAPSVTIHHEIIGKMFRDDAEIELQLTYNQLQSIRLQHYEELIASGVTNAQIETAYKNISQNADKWLAAQRGQDAQPDAGRVDPTGSSKSPPQFSLSQKPRTGGVQGVGKTLKPFPFAKNRPGSVGQDGQRIPQTLFSRPTNVAGDAFPDIEGIPESELTMEAHRTRIEKVIGEWMSAHKLGWAYDGRREVTPAEGLGNTMRAGYLLGFSVGMTNLQGNPVNQIAEQVVKIVAGPLDWANSKVNPKSGYERHNPGLSGLDILTGLFGERGMFRTGLFNKGDGGVWKVLKEGVGDEEREKFDLLPQTAKAKEAKEGRWDKNVVRNSGIPAWDLAIEGSVRMSSALDRPFKAFKNASEIRGLARLTAVKLRKEGVITRKQQRAFMNELNKDPNAWMKAAARRSAENDTFQNPNAVSDTLNKLKKQLLTGRFLSDKTDVPSESATNRVVGQLLYVTMVSAAPFLNTPVNIGVRAMEWSPLGLGLAAVRAWKMGEGHERVEWAKKLAEKWKKEDSMIAKERLQENRDIKSALKRFSAEKQDAKAKLDQYIADTKASTALTEEGKKAGIKNARERYGRWKAGWENSKSKAQQAVDKKLADAGVKRAEIDEGIANDRKREEAEGNRLHTTLESNAFTSGLARTGMGTVVGGAFLAAVFFGILKAVGYVDYDDDQEEWEKRRDAGIKDASISVSTPEFSVTGFGPLDGTYGGNYSVPYDNSPPGKYLAMAVTAMEQARRPGTGWQKADAVFWRTAWGYKNLFPYTDDRFNIDDKRVSTGKWVKSITPFVNMKILEEIADVVDDKDRTTYKQGVTAPFRMTFPRDGIKVLGIDPLPEPKHPMGKRQPDWMWRAAQKVNPMRSIKQVKEKDWAPSPHKK